MKEGSQSSEYLFYETNPSRAATTKKPNEANNVGDLSLPKGKPPCFTLVKMQNKAKILRFQSNTQHRPKNKPKSKRSGDPDAHRDKPITSSVALCAALWQEMQNKPKPDAATMKKRNEAKSSVDRASRLVLLSSRFVGIPYF